jgi:hypothetical protein
MTRWASASPKSHAPSPPAAIPKDSHPLILISPPVSRTACGNSPREHTPPAKGAQSADERRCTFQDRWHPHLLVCPVASLHPSQNGVTVPRGSPTACRLVDLVDLARRAPQTNGGQVHGRSTAPMGACVVKRTCWSGPVTSGRRGGGACCCGAARSCRVSCRRVRSGSPAGAPGAGGERQGRRRGRMSWTRASGGPMIGSEESACWFRGLLGACFPGWAWLAEWSHMHPSGACLWWWAP